MEDTTSGWFTIDNGTMLVWEGVCMLKLDKVIYLFKIRNEGIFSIKIPIANVKKVSSDGYWDCAEILGCFGKAGATFYYHADCIKSARQMLMHLTAFTSTEITTLTVRFDPDPLRYENLRNISDRITMWTHLGMEFCTNCRVVLDSKMPL